MTMIPQSVKRLDMRHHRYGDLDFLDTTFGMIIGVAGIFTVAWGLPWALLIVGSAIGIAFP